MIAIRQIDGVTEYFVDRKYHRVNGPAIEWDHGGGAWWLFGERHRYYGPRGEYDCWYIHGEQIK